VSIAHRAAAHTEMIMGPGRWQVCGQIRKPRPRPLGHRAAGLWPAQADL